MSFLRRKNPPGLIAATLLLVSLLVYVFFIKPLQENISRVQEDLIREKALFIDLQTRRDNLKRLELTLPSGELPKLLLLTAIPDALNQDDLILDFHRLASENRISFDSLTFGLSDSSEFGEDLKTVSISSTFRGTEKTLIQFLQSLENNPRKIIVNSISVSVEDGFSTPHDDGIVSFSLNMKAFYQESAAFKMTSDTNS